MDLTRGQTRGAGDGCRTYHDSTCVGRAVARETVHSTVTMAMHASLRSPLGAPLLVVLACGTSGPSSAPPYAELAGDGSAASAADDGGVSVEPDDGDSSPLDGSGES